MFLEFLLCFLYIIAFYGQKSTNCLKIQLYIIYFKKYYIVQGTLLERIEVNGGMNETTTAKNEKTYMNYLSEKKRNKAIYAMLPYYENVIILGDSLAESILDYRLLRKKNVIAKRGRCVDMIEGDIQRAICMAPEMIILEYGKNDILHFRDNFTSFITSCIVNISIH